MRITLKNIMRKLVPAEEIAGIEVADSAARLFMFSADDMRPLAVAEAALPPGAVVKGEVKNAAALAQAFLTLKRQTPYFAKNPLAILTLPSSVFFTHLLSLPEIASGTYEEAARLNAIQVSPIKLEDAYFDWQNVGVNLKTLERELLIGVAPKAAVDPYVASLRQAGIEPVAVEPNALSLLRILGSFAPTFDQHDPHIVVNVTQDGLHFVIGKAGKPLFAEYLFWYDFMETKSFKVSRDDFEAVLLREMKKLVDFYGAHHEERITRIVILSPVLKDAIAELLRGMFGMEIIGFRLPLVAGRMLSDAWGGAIGAALRGIIPRKGDTIISLMQLGTEEAYAQKRFISFVSLWGKVAAGTLVGLAAASAIAAGIIFQTQKRLAESYVALRGTAAAKDLAEFERQAVEFNQLVSGASQAEKSAVDWSRFLEPIAVSAEEGLGFDRISVSAGAGEMRIQARARSREAALAFKRKLEASGVFRKVDLPIGSFATVADGVAFSLVLELELTTDN